MTSTAAAAPRHLRRDDEAVEQHLPCGQRRERKSRSISIGHALRLVTDDALVDEMELGVGTWSIDRARVPDIVSHAETRGIVANAHYLTHGIPAENAGLATLGRAPCTNLHVDRVHRNRSHSDEQVLARGDGILELEVEERVRAFDRTRGDIANGFHDGQSRAVRSLSRCEAEQGWASFGHTAGAP